MEIKDYFSEQFANIQPISETQISAMIEQREKDGYFEKENSYSKEYFQSKIGKYLLFYIQQFNDSIQLDMKSVFSDEIEQQLGSKHFARMSSVFPVFS